MASLLSTYASENAQAEAEAIAQTPESQRSFDTLNFALLVAELRRHDALDDGIDRISVGSQRNTEFEG